jgi:hypothetical protein
MVYVCMTLGDTRENFGPTCMQAGQPESVTNCIVRIICMYFFFFFFISCFFLFMNMHACILHFKVRWKRVNTKISSGIYIIPVWPREVIPSPLINRTKNNDMLPHSIFSFGTSIIISMIPTKAEPLLGLRALVLDPSKKKISSAPKFEKFL